MNKQYFLNFVILLQFACSFLCNATPPFKHVNKKEDLGTMKLQIIQLPTTSWQSFQAMRLEALKTNPLDFGSTYQEELSTSEEQWRNRLSNMWFAVVDGNIVGMIGLVRDIGKTSMHRAHVISLWIKPTFRRQSIGVKLITHLQKYAPTQGIKKLYLHVNSKNLGAISLYEKQGFKKVGLREKHINIDDSYVDTYLMEWLCNPF